MKVFSRILSLVSLLSVLTIDTRAAVSATGETITLGGVAYFVPPTPVSQLKVGLLGALLEGAELVPFTFVSSSGSKFTQGDLTSLSSTFGASDDVWQSAFLQGVYVSGKSLVTAAPGKDTKIVISSSVVPVTKAIPNGPYLVDPPTGNIYEAWRLYSDTNGACLYGTIPDGKGGYKQLPAHIDGDASQSVAVPSRLYFTPSTQKPLAGKRLAVKDIFDIAGTKTSCGNRAFYDLYPAKTKTGPAIQRLIDGGAIVVCKTFPSQFANGETATDDWVDFHAPYNPRGDGYQDGSSSSTGSGVSVASYDWLDYAVGSDTGGSMRGPAGANGVYGNRPSHGAVALDDVMPLSTELDTAGIFARDAKTWKAAGDWWYKDYKQYDKYPTKILFPVDSFSGSFLSNPPLAGTSDAIFNDFIKKLEGFLNTTRTEMNLTDSWLQTSPLIAKGQNPPPPLRQLLNTTYADLITIDQIALVADPFIADYKAAKGGRSPFIDPAPLNRWAYGRGLANQTQQKIDAIANKTVFMDWIQQEVLGSNNETCSNAIFLYPQSSGRTSYRNRYITPPTAPFGFSSGRLSVHAEVPDMVVPIGEAPYNSTITGTVEHLPVTISFIAQKACDLMLFSLFDKLADAGILKEVKTGSTLFL
ncbi:amidase signature enzyme [Trametopsis cervina]|nr:amidase signature enzyme [Trametopsis cervina]